MQQPGLANLFNNPMAMMQLASGFLQPGPNQGSRIGAGLANIAPTMATMMQLQEMTKQQQKQTDMEEALKRMSDPTAAAYTPTPVADGGLSKLAAAPANSMTPEQMLATGQTPAQFSMMGDMMKLAPGAVIEARMKQLTDPLSGMPDEIKKLHYFADNPDLAALASLLDPTGPQAEADALGFDLSKPEGQLAFREYRQNKGRTNVNIQTGDNMLERGVAEVAKEDLGTARTNFEGAISSARELARMRQNLQAGLKTGRLADARSLVSNVLLEFGVDGNTMNKFYNTTEGADFEAASNSMVQAIIKQFGPNPSNADLAFARDIVPQLKQSPAAATRLIDRINSRNTQVISQYRSALDALPQNSPNAEVLRALYKAKIADYQKSLGLARPEGLPEGANFAFTDINGNDIYQFPDGTYKRWVK